MECIHSHQTTDLDEVSQTEGFLQLVVEVVSRTRDIDIRPELFLDRIDTLDTFLQALCGTTHSDEVPHDKTQLFMDRIHRALTLNSHQFVNLILYSLLRLSELRQVGRHARNTNLVREVVLDGVRQNEVTVSQTLHEGRSTETVSTVVGEVRLADTEQALYGRLELVVNPDTTHRIVDSREDHHRVLVRVLVHDLLVHLEEVSVLLSHYIFAQTLDSLAEVKEDSQTGVVDAVSLVATLFGSTRSYVTRHQVTKGRITTLEIVIAIFFGDITTLDLTGLQTLCILQFLRHPDTTVVTERLRHEGQLTLEITMLRDTGRVDLRVAGVSEQGTVAVHLHSSRTVGSHGVGREEEGVTVTTRTYYYCMREETLDATGNEVTSDDTTCTRFAVLILDQHDIQHLIAGVHLHFAFTDLTAERAVCAEQQLLTGLTLCIEGTTNLRATEGTVVEQTAVFTSERNTLRHTLVDDVITYLRQTIYVRLTRTVVTSLDRIVVETIYGVTIVLVVLRCVDTTLRSDRVRTTRTVLDTEVQYVESHLCERSSSRSTGETRTYNNHVETTFVGRVNEFLMVLIVRPLKLQRSCRDLGHLRGNDRSSFLTRGSHYFGSSFGCATGFLSRIFRCIHCLLHFCAVSYLLCAGLQFYSSFLSFLHHYFSSLYSCLSSLYCYFLSSI